MHYDNPGAAQGIVDASGVRVHGTTTLRQHEASTFSVGDSRIALRNTKLPGLTRWDFNCPSGVTTQFQGGPVTAFARQLHAHTTGVSMRSRQLDSDGKLLRESETQVAAPRPALARLMC